ncbi:MAG: DUF3990 domain-containing protein [Treponema sp.]|jgi:hypothetical protein|nr:DUF3990 domain-containing protein [Treponema sp.]
MRLFHGSNQDFDTVDLSNRTQGGLQHRFDIVQGPVANDNTTRTIALYVASIYTAEMALQQLRYFRPNNQVSVHTEKALAGLVLIKKDRYGE